MAFVVSAVVGAIGAAIGTAIGTAIGGTILGISVATIGGIVGAGLAGGVLSMVRGGDFGKGFLMAAGGAALGGFMKGSFDSALTAGASGDTVQSLLDAQGGVEFAPNAFESGALSGATADVSTFGLGDMAAPQGTALGESTSTGLGDSIPTGLDGTTQAAQANGSLFADNNFDITGSNPSTQTSISTDPYSSAISSTNTPTASLSDTVGSGATTPSTPLESTTGNIGTPPTLLDNAGVTQAQTMAAENAAVANAPTPTVTTQSGRGGLGDMWHSANDSWNKTMPSGAPSLGKTLLGTGQYMMDQYNSSKLDRINKGMAPLSFDDWKARYMPDAQNKYAAASNQMAKSGHTGTLPLLMANMNKDAQAGYSSYLPGAQASNYKRQADASALRTNSLTNLFKTTFGAA